MVMNFGLFADNGKIDLPDLTTEVSSETTDVEDIPTPDFSDVVTVPETTGSLVPELPEVEVIEGKDVVVSSSEEDGKQIYAEGQIGGGYPASFIGNFSVSKIFGANPFTISFDHESSAGYGGTELSEGYNNNNTSIVLDKIFNFNNITLELTGNYEDSGNGLQNKSESISAVNRDVIGGTLDFLWELPYGFSVGSLITSDFYYRFAEITYNSSDSFTCPDWIRKKASFVVSPSVFAKWENNSFKVGLDAGYSFGDFTNRGEFTTDFSWTNDKVKLFTDVGIVIGDNLNDNTFVIPFTLGVESSLPVYFSDNTLDISLTGGMESYRSTIGDMERLFNFSAFEEIPSETSNWYSSFSLLVPLKSAFSAKIGIDYKTTAFNNGIWQPNYDSSTLVNGLYGFEMKNSESFATTIDITYRYKLFAITAEWNANWLDVPALENKQNFSITTSLQSKEGKWGTSLSAALSLDSEDYTPELDFEAYLQASSSAKFVISANDILKLVTGKTRVYAGDYISNSGNVTMLVKFLF